MTPLMSCITFCASTCSFRPSSRWKSSASRAASRASPRDRTFTPILLKRGSDRELEGAQLLSLPAIHLDAVVETERAERRQPAHARADVGADALVEVRARRIDVARVVEAGDP